MVAVLGISQQLAPIHHPACFSQQFTGLKPTVEDLGQTAHMKYADVLKLKWVSTTVCVTSAYIKISEV